MWQPSTKALFLVLLQDCLPVPGRLSEASYYRTVPLILETPLGNDALPLASVNEPDKTVDEARLGRKDLPVLDQALDERASCQRRQTPQDS